MLKLSTALIQLRMIKQTKHRITPKNNNFALKVVKMISDMNISVTSFARISHINTFFKKKI